ncbi:MAG: UbiA-like polyprenyltransferase [Candidatus Binatia bacterium]
MSDFRFSILDFRFLSQSKIQNLKSKIGDYGRLIRFSHTIFALPFALASAALASVTHPVSWNALLWILIAMAGARSAAMGFNRLADRKIDALNPRTKNWELPQGTVSVREAAALTVVASLVFIYAAYKLNPLCLTLSPVALAIIFFYSLTKRFTWTSHLFLGLSLSLAPMGAWLAITGYPHGFSELTTPLFLSLAVLFWLAGFDVLYSLQDHQFDRAQGLHSIPVRFGVERGLRLSSFFHALTVLFLVLVGAIAGLGAIYWFGVFGISLILFWEHRLVTSTDFSRIDRAFFDFNAYVSVGYFIVILADRFLR